MALSNALCVFLLLLLPQSPALRKTDDSSLTRSEPLLDHQADGTSLMMNRVFRQVTSRWNLHLSGRYFGTNFKTKKKIIDMFSEKYAANYQRVFSGTKRQPEAKAFKKGAEAWGASLVKWKKENKCLWTTTLGWLSASTVSAIVWGEWRFADKADKPDEKQRQKVQFAYSILGGSMFGGAVLAPRYGALMTLLAKTPKGSALMATVLSPAVYTVVDDMMKKAFFGEKKWLCCSLAGKKELEEKNIDDKALGQSMEKPGEMKPDELQLIEATLETQCQPCDDWNMASIIVSTLMEDPSMEDIYDLPPGLFDL